MRLYSVAYLFLIHITKTFSGIHEFKTIFITALRHASAVFYYADIGTNGIKLLGKIAEITN